MQFWAASASPGRFRPFRLCVHAAVAVLAAGKGTKSALPKVLQPLAGATVERVLASARNLEPGVGS